MKLVDYGDSDSENDIPVPVQVPVQSITKPAIKKLNIEDLNKLSKKQKIEEPQKSSIDIIDMELEEELKYNNIPQTVKSTKFCLALPKPKNKIEDKGFVQNYKKKLPPPPPGVNFKDAENLTNSISKEDKQLIDEYDKDDEFIQDPKAINKPKVNMAYEDIDLNDENIKVKMMKIVDQDDKYWQIQRDKIMQEQQIYMKAPEINSFAKKEKNHIDSLYYQASLKDQQYQEKKSEQMANKEKKKQRYAW